ncbi:hypothetical protein [Cellulophaga lytica]|uniref:hypothetical protein n=1 Tax=Cellulophaga lytica TaxID=979 RepID=UPI0011315D66|nr:hypothetical protein [Cellulophaga lytica]
MKRRRLNILTLFLLCSFCSYSQNIIDLFYMLPEEYTILGKQERKSLVKNKKISDGEMNQNIFIDKKNGYLSVNTSFDSNINTEIKFEMCYRNFENKKLIAISTYGGNTRTYSYGQSDFKFFIYDNDLKISDKPIFKEYYPNLEVTKRLIITDFYSKMTRKQILEYESLYPSLTFSLPRKGKNIEIKYKNQKPVSDFGPFFDIPSKILKWNGDGTFSE